MFPNAWKVLILLMFAHALLTFAEAGDRRHSDVENIGLRKINGRVAWIFPNFITFKKELAMGAQYAHMIEA